MKTAVFVLGCGAFILLSALCGTPWYALPLCAACALCYIVLPGRLLLRLLPQPLRKGAMRPALTLLLGMVYLCAVYVPAVRLWQPLLQLLVLPLAAAALLLDFRALRAQPVMLAARLRAVPPELWNLLALLGVLFALCSVTLCLPNALPSALGARAVHQDMLWNAGNAASLKSSFPPWDARFLGIRLQYHFFSDLLAALFSMLSGLSCFEVYLGGMQPLLLGALALCLYCLGLTVFHGSRPKSLLLVLLVFTASSASLWLSIPGGIDLFGNTHITHILTNPNGQTTAALACALFAGLYLPLARGATKAFWARALLCLLAFGMLCLTKGPQAAIVACAVLPVGLYALLSRQWHLRMFLFSLALPLLFLASYLLLYSGGAQNSMFLDVRATLDQGVFAPYAVLDGPIEARHWLMALVQMLLVLPLPVFCAAYALVRAVRQQGLRRLPPALLLCLAVGAGGLWAFTIFGHSAYSQLYFLFVAIPFLCLPAANVIPGLLRSGKKQWAVRAVLCLLLAGTAITAASGYTRLAVYSIQGLRQPPAHMLPYTPADEAAAHWLRENTPKDTIFAVNRSHAGPAHQGISNFFTAISERHAFMEGYSYVQSNMGIPEAMLTDRWAENGFLYNAESRPEDILRVAQNAGIQYLVYTEGGEGSRQWLAGFEVVYEGAGTAVFRLY